MLERIEAFAFSGCPLSEIELPSSIQSIDQNAFGGNVWSVISFTRGNCRYRCRDDLFEDTEDHVLMHVLCGKKKVLVDCSIEVIRDGSLAGQWVFQNSSHLRVVDHGAFRWGRFRLVTFPASLIVIGKSAFEQALIKEVRFEQNSKLERIERKAFHMSRLRKMIIPKTVKYIGKYAFSTCWNPEIRLEKHSRLWRIPSGARKQVPDWVCSVS
jgi:hypothetical protein